jgi:class 3 adenylate cyclase
MNGSTDSSKNAHEHVHRRFDFVFEVLSQDDETRTVTFLAKPDPRRYEWRSVSGKNCLYDKFDDLFFPEDLVAKFIDGLKELPIDYEPQKIGDAAAYVRSRRPLILSFLHGKQPPPTFADPSDEFLGSLETDKLQFVVLSLDLVGSTRLATTLPATEYTRLIQTALFEISAVVPLFHGHVLKYTGDGIIAYFPAPSFITKNDLALDCALTLRRLVHDALNPVLVDIGHEPINVRIGLDSGEAAVVAIGSPTTKQHKDIIGAVISLACKIQSRVPVGGIALGDITLRNLHTDWRTICCEMDVGPDWKYMDPETGEPYRVHKVRLD